ncbi:DUF4097 domain-containing protein [Cohnella fermenti]|uniref:DUF4097 domain-containing protein n=1 Tax=Cohnella fermenti TaxID=2565925 RepID=A0A4S4CE64_9BACL|nr:DUF4097 domain-containing protein [Cohnella fermenti]
MGLGGAAFYNFQFGEDKQTYEHAWTFDADELKQLSILADSQSLNIAFEPSGDGSNAIRISGKAPGKVIDQIKQAQLSNGALKISMKEGWSFGAFDFDFGSSQQVTVSLSPEAAKALQVFKVDTDSGSIRIGAAESSQVAQAAQGDIESDSGSIKLYGFQGETLKLESDSGSIYAENVAATLSVSSDSGSIKVEHLNGTSTLKSDSGSIKLTKDDTASADIKSDSGSVRVEVPSEFGGSYDLRSDSGSIHSPDSQNRTRDVIKVRTDSGSIRVTAP